MAVLVGGSVGAITQRALWAQTDAASATDQPADEVKTLAVVAVASYDELLSDINFAGSLADRPEAGQMLEGMISLFTQGKGLAGVDKSKPWGIVVQSDGLQFLPIGCLPAKDLDSLIGLSTPFGVQVDEGSEGVKVLSLPNEKKFYVRTESGWAFLGLTAESLTYAPHEPGALFSQLVADYDVAASVSVQNAPEIYRQQAILALQAGLNQGLNQKPGEDDAQFEARQKLAKLQMDQLVQLMEELDGVTIGWAVDSQQQRTYADFSYRFLPGSKTANQLNSQSQPQTNFAGFYSSKAAVTMSFASKTDPALIQSDVEQFRATIGVAREQIMSALDEEDEFPDDETRDAVKEALTDFLGAVEATIASGEMDGGGSLMLEPERMTIVGGMLVKEPDKIESGLRKVAAAAEKDPEFPGVQWNVASHAGVNFHTLQVPVPESEEKARKMFGEQLDIAVGIGPEAVYFGAGNDCLNAVQQAIDASQAEPNKRVPLAELSISLGPIMRMAAFYEQDAKKQQVAQSIADMLQGEAQGRDHIRMVGLVIPNGLRYRVEAEEGVLRAFGNAVAEAQAQAELP